MALTDNLTAYYKLDESSGDAADATGGGYTLTNNGTTTYSSAKINNGADFGTSNSTKFLSRTTPVITGNITVSFWFKANSEPASGINDGIFSIHDNSTSLKNYGVFYQNNAGTKRIQFDYHKNNVSDNYVTYNVTLGTTNWNHFAFTWNGTTFTGYFNGASVGTPLTISGGGSGTVGTNGPKIGKTERFTIYSQGMIDECGIWSRALSGSEITSLYNSGSGLAYPFSTTNIKTINGLAYASVKNVNGLAIASVKNINGLA